LFVIGNFI